MQRQPLRSRIPLKALIVAHGVRRRRYRKSPDLASEGGATGRDAAAFHVGREADAARPVSPATAQATMRRGTRDSHITWTPGRPQRQAQPVVDPRHGVDSPRAPEVIAEFLVDLALVLPRRMTRASPQQCGGAPVRNTLGGHPKPASMSSWSYWPVLTRPLRG